MDTKLKALLPPLIDAYLAFLITNKSNSQASHHVVLDVAISEIIYTFCKVRGEKVISGFFNNEPRYLDLILSALESAVEEQQASGNEQRKVYVLMLWLSHLLLAPFDLSTVSKTEHSSALAIPVCGMPDGCPAVVTRILNLVIGRLHAVTRQQDVAAKMLVRLIDRPDMQKIGLHDKIIPYIILSIRSNPGSETNAASVTGWMRCLVSITANCADNASGMLIEDLWNMSTDLYNNNFEHAEKSSSLHRKLVIKMLRNITLAGMRGQTSKVGQFSQGTGILEDVIEKLLGALHDKDTQVRMGTAKAIGAIISRLDKDLASQVIAAVIDEFDLFYSHDTTLLTLRDSSKWHGLTLTLAHALFKRSALPEQLPTIINVLLQAIEFEKRNATGLSLGANVRDAACFAIWSMSRRYTTAELKAVDVEAISSTDLHKSTFKDIIPFLAIQLLKAACLDPNGNIRRGCSAALQELIGRHPDQVSSGISLIQIVDYQGVGLRRRAMVDLAYRAVELDNVYLIPISDALMGWRGLGSPDVASRESAAISLVRLTIKEDRSDLKVRWEQLHDILRSSKKNEVDLQHGALLALSGYMEAYMRLGLDAARSGETLALDTLVQICSDLDKSVCRLLPFTPRAVQEELPPAVAVFVTSLCKVVTYFCPATRSDGVENFLKRSVHSGLLTKLLEKLVVRSDDNTLHVIPSLLRAVLDIQVSDPQHSIYDTASAVHELAVDSQRHILHGAGRAFAIATAIRTSQCNDTLTSTTSTFVNALCALVAGPEIDWRIIGLRAMLVGLGDVTEDQSILVECLSDIVATVIIGLNDYTITERGDVGSLARLEALKCARLLWNFDIIVGNKDMCQSLQANILRLSLEKLDKVRLAAAQTLQHLSLLPDSISDIELTLASITSHEYFSAHLRILLLESIEPWQELAILRGLSSSAGMAAESQLQAARSAYMDVLQDADPFQRGRILSTISQILRDQSDPQPILELSAFTLDNDVMNPTSLDPEFKWLTLLSRVQKSHFKSSIIPRLIAAIEVYRHLGRVEILRKEILKKLCGMIKTNPFPKVRFAAGECLWNLTGEEGLIAVDWTKDGKEHGDLLDLLGKEKMWY